jgi:tRNA dimethylallyltransferase
MVSHQNRVAIVLVGPTGVGKTYLSLLIAKKISVEIVSADSRQIYMFMDIGTAKPTKDILKDVPHHFINVLKPDEDFSAGKYSLEARNVVNEIVKRGNVPLIVGGSGLYIKALLEGFSTKNTQNSEYRKMLQEKLDLEGKEVLYNQLKEIDWDSAINIHPNNTKRVLRALEIYLVSGIPASKLYKINDSPLNFSNVKFGLTREREDLYREINGRVDQMFKNGLVEEVRNILKKGYGQELNSLNSVGYKEVIQYLSGEMNLKTCIDLVKRNSRRYAKRQLTWFRKDSDIKWITVEKESDFNGYCTEIIDTYMNLVNSKK